MTAKFANLHMFSDVRPYEVVRSISASTLEIREMTAVLDPDWKPEILPGGFAGHCVNQSSQRWIYKSDENAPVIRIRRVNPRNNRGYEWKSVYGVHKLADQPRRFHDYNF